MAASKLGVISCFNAAPFSLAYKMATPYFVKHRLTAIRYGNFVIIKRPLRTQEAERIILLCVLPTRFWKLIASFKRERCFPMDDKRLDFPINALHRVFIGAYILSAKSLHLNV